MNKNAEVINLFLKAAWWHLNLDNNLFYNSIILNVATILIIIFREFLVLKGCVRYNFAKRDHFVKQNEKPLFVLEIFKFM